LLDRLDAEASSAGISMTALVASVLEEGLKTRRFPGVAYRDGPAGRRAALVGGPDVWEVIRAVGGASGKGDQRVQRVAEERGLPADRIRLAVDFYIAFPNEIDERILADDEAAQRLRLMVDRRERLLSS
jgi:hypothetical protein